MPIVTKRWNDPVHLDDGFRILVCRYRPRGLPKQQETWHAWYKELAPSKELHADLYGKSGKAITWEEFRLRYLQEMATQTPRLEELAQLSSSGKVLCLLCSSACVDPARCHRSLLRELIEQQVVRLQAATGGDA